MSHEDVTAVAKLCCQHLYSFDSEAPYNEFFSVEFNVDELADAAARGDATIGKLINDFLDVAAVVTMPDGGKGITRCGSRGKSAHGLAFRLGKRLARAIHEDADTSFIDHDEIETLWDGIRHEQNELRRKSASTGYLTERQLAGKHGINLESLRGRLRKHRQATAMQSVSKRDWMEVETDGQQNVPKYLFRESEAVRAIIDELKNRSG